MAVCKDSGMAQFWSLGCAKFMSTQTFTTIRTASTPAEAGLLISILEQAGLHPLELDTASHCTFGGAEIFYSVRVPTDESAEAGEILSEYDRNSA
jgi:hypothetical protein